MYAHFQSVKTYHGLHPESTERNTTTTSANKRVPYSSSSAGSTSGASSRDLASLRGQAQQPQALQRQQTSRENSQNSMIQQTPSVEDGILTNTRNAQSTMNSLGPHKRNLARSQERVSSYYLNRSNYQPTTLRLYKNLPAQVWPVYIYIPTALRIWRWTIVNLVVVCRLHHIEAPMHIKPAPLTAPLDGSLIETSLKAWKAWFAPIVAGSPLGRNGMNGNAFLSAANLRYQFGIMSSLGVSSHQIMPPSPTRHESSKDVLAADEECQAWRCHVAAPMQD